jgi:hypothetical protein
MRRIDCFTHRNRVRLCRRALRGFSGSAQIVTAGLNEVFGRNLRRVDLRRQWFFGRNLRRDHLRRKWFFNVALCKKEERNVTIGTRTSSNMGK